MLKSITRLTLLLCTITSLAQQSQEIRQDSVVYLQPYGLRLGADLSKPLLTTLNDDYRGFELVGDYRITEDLYLAGELGNEENTREEVLGGTAETPTTLLYNYTTSGSYLKLGVDLNTYDNWYGMNNSIYIGGRYAFATLSQELNEYNIYNSNRYWNPDSFTSSDESIGTYKGLNASWLEFLFGVKAELFANIYLGASARIGFLVSNKEAEEFPNLWIPGFNKVTEGSRFGVNYNYSISYFLPLYKKPRSPKSEE